jgi:dipeptidyl aminopeptidase/acylaminoacyl peptidase
LANATEGAKGPAFDHARLAEELSQATGAKFEANNLKLDGLTFDANDTLTGLTFEGKRYSRKADGWKPGGTDPAGNSHDRLQPVGVRARSGGSSVETSILFDNQLKQPVEIFWVAGDGSSKSYGVVPPGRTRDQHTFASHVWSVKLNGRDLNSYRATEAAGRVVIDSDQPPKTGPGNENGARRPGPAPSDGSVFVRDHNLFQKLADGSSRQLTTDGNAKDGYRGAVFIAAGGKRAIAMRTLAGDGRKLTLVEAAPKDQLQPRVTTVDYPKPGDAIDRDMPHLFDLENQREIPLDSAPWENPWSNNRGQWSPDGTKFWFLHNRRGHQLLRLIEIDATTGKSRVVVEEKSPTFIDYAHKNWWRILPARNRVVWMSERSGHNHLHLFELSTGKELKPVTSGEWVIREVERFDENTGTFRLKVGGIHPGQDPYQVHFALAHLDGRPVVPLTESDGTHEVEDGPEGKNLVARHSRVDRAPVTEVRDAQTGKLLVELEKADTTALEKAGWHAPERFVTAGRDGKTPIHGIIHRPRDFYPSRKYPVIEYIYAGPQDAFVPKSFRLMHGAQKMCEIGAVVVQIDGMGTSRRSKAFHDVCCKNLADAGFPDRKIWMREAAKSRPWMDLTRVGIYGGSAGGQNALRALLSHGDFYHAAVADCGCHDNRIDKIWWNELWMGWPIGPHYEAQAAQTDAAKLQGKLLLTVGEIDSNVDPACTLRVVKALIQAGKTFEYLVLPGLGHGAGESPFAARERVRFFLQHLVLARPAP